MEKIEGESGRVQSGPNISRGESVVPGTGAGFVDAVHRVIRHRRPNSAGPRQRSIGFHLGAACNEPNPLIELRRNAPTTEPLQDYNTRITVDEQCGDRSHTFRHARILIGLMSDPSLFQPLRHILYFTSKYCNFI